MLTICRGNAVATTVDLQVGSGSGQTMTVTLKSWVPEVAWAAEDTNCIG